MESGWPTVGYLLLVPAVDMTERRSVTASGTAYRLWGRILRLMTTRTEQQTFTWGVVAWCTETGPAMGYESATDNTAIRSHGGKTSVLPVPDYSAQPWSRERPQRWKLISTLGALFIWRARWTCVFEGSRTPQLRLSETFG